MRPSTEEHDYQVRLRSAVKFLAKVRLIRSVAIVVSLFTDWGPPERLLPLCSAACTGEASYGMVALNVYC